MVIERKEVNKSTIRLWYSIEFMNEKNVYEKDIEFIVKKKSKLKKLKVQKTRNSVFKNNYKNFEYDYEEDFYDPDNYFD
ncbi:hypothetical protein [Tepidibacter thalassicus]|uniref:Uncharacterized protein n=1 Tax=Tepidibacter thalassicus DSM 15285 TaxID=1123350 RepID=A0A1M5RUQ8_9FIRM|nr:hypothetical protein [Tepidibacter thalassicus]SHH29920.1 hypothetical protein SAMN02744040_01509 [Tepidibacter thalassicus DSM 15285]